MIITRDIINDITRDIINDITNDIIRDNYPRYHP